MQLNVWNFVSEIAQVSFQSVFQFYVYYYYIHRYMYTEILASSNVHFSTNYVFYKVPHHSFVRFNFEGSALQHLEIWTKFQSCF